MSTLTELRIFIHILFKAFTLNSHPIVFSKIDLIWRAYGMEKGDLRIRILFNNCSKTIGQFKYEIPKIQTGL